MCNVHEQRLHTRANLQGKFLCQAAWAHIVKGVIHMYCMYGSSAAAQAGMEAYMQ